VWIYAELADAAAVLLSSIDILFTALIIIIIVWHRDMQLKPSQNAQYTISWMTNNLQDDPWTTSRRQGGREDDIIINKERKKRKKEIKLSSFSRLCSSRAKFSSSAIPFLDDGAAIQKELTRRSQRIRTTPVP
jgi:hypothetical protein